MEVCFIMDVLWFFICRHWRRDCKREWTPVYSQNWSFDWCYSKVEVLDIGCGYGGLLGMSFFFALSHGLVALAKILPDMLCLGLEIRLKVVEYVHLRILNLREENPPYYKNISVLRTNTMKYLANYIGKGQVFPTPILYGCRSRRSLFASLILISKKRIIVVELSSMLNHSVFDVL